MIVVPSRREVLVYSAVTLVCLITMTALVFALDLILTKGILRLLV